MRPHLPSATGNGRAGSRQTHHTKMFLGGCLAILVASSMVAFDTSRAAESALPSPKSSSDSSNKRDAPIRVGDKIKISFYEILDTDEAKWRGPNGRASTAPREFHERAELAGEYTVQEDGAVSVPLLGAFPAAGRDRATLVNALTAALEGLVGRKGYVNVLALERQPVYVVGPVKNPGPFKYERGLTALHAVALAGGLRRTDVEAWQNIETRREIVALEKSLDKVKRLLARTVVLRTSGTGDVSSPMRELAGLLGKQEAALLVGQESAKQRLSQINQAVQGSALTAAVTNYRAELASRTGRVAPFDENIKLRTERVRGLAQLVQQNLATRAALVQAQGELTDVQDRRQQVLIEVDATRQKLLQSEQDLARHTIETKLEIEQAVASAERDSADAVTNTEGSLNVLRTFDAAKSADSGDGTVFYEIIRSGNQGSSMIEVSETTLLEPGDLLRVRSKKTSAEADLTASLGKSPSN